MGNYKLLTKWKLRGAYTNPDHSDKLVMIFPSADSILFMVENNDKTRSMTVQLPTEQALKFGCSLIESARKNRIVQKKRDALPKYEVTEIE